MATAVQVESILGGLTDNSGQPLAAGKVYTYYAGTTTPVSLYTSSDKSTSATNPLILDGHGKAQVWADGRYKFVVKDQYDVTQYTLDNLLYGFDDSTVLWGGQSTGSANVHNVSVPATVGVYANGQRVSFIAGYTNTGATTLQLNTLGAVSIVKGPNATSLQAGDIVAGQLVDCVYEAYSGTGRFRLESSPAVADIQRSRYVYATNVGGTNVIVAELTPALSSYEAGLAIRFKASAANTGAVTINLNSLGSKAVQRYGVALVGGEIKADDIVELVYDGAQFQLVNATPAPLFIDRTNNRVGIGTVTPSGVVDVQNVSPTAYITAFKDDATAGAVFLQKSRGATVGTNTIVQANDSLGSIYFTGANGTGFTEGALIRASVDGTPGASNDMPVRLGFFTTPDGSGSLLERLRLESNGNVCIGGGPSRAGTTKLDVLGRIATGSGNYDAEIAFTRPTTAGQTAWNMAVRTDVGGSNEDFKLMRFIGGAYQNIPFQVQSLTGNVGIGTSSPTSALTVSGPISTTNSTAGVHLGVTGSISGIELANSGGGYIDFTSTSSDSLARIIFVPTGGANNLQIHCIAAINFWTGGFERGGIDTSGYWYLGQSGNRTNPVGANTYIDAASGAIYRATSSLKYKRDVKNYTKGLAEVLALRPVSFKSKDSSPYGDDFEFAGLIAEEVDAAGMTEFVQYAADQTPDGLSYGHMVALAFKAIQELNAKVESLQAQIAGA